jgi:hypothetical protein
MWLLADTDGKKVLCSEPEHILQFVKNRDECYSIEWIAVYEPPKERTEPEYMVQRAAQAVPLSRTKEKD